MQKETCFSSFCALCEIIILLFAQNSTEKNEHQKVTIVYNFELNVRICEMKLRQKQQIAHHVLLDENKRKLRASETIKSHSCKPNIIRHTF